MGDPRCNRRYSTLNGRAVNERRKKLALRPPQKWALFAVKRPRLKRSAINKRRGGEEGGDSVFKFVFVTCGGGRGCDEASLFAGYF